MSTVEKPAALPAVRALPSPHSEIMEPTATVDEAADAARFHAELRARLAVLAQVRAHLAAMTVRRTAKAMK